MSDSERKLARLFDFQKFSGNERLNKLIAETEARISAEKRCLSDEEVNIWAAGDVDELEVAQPASVQPLLVAETLAGIDSDGVKHQHRQRVACRGLNEMIHAGPHVLQRRRNLDCAHRILRMSTPRNHQPAEHCQY